MTEDKNQENSWGGEIVEKYKSAVLHSYFFSQAVLEKKASFDDFQKVLPVLLREYNEDNLFEPPLTAHFDELEIIFEVKKNLKFTAIEFHRTKEDLVKKEIIRSISGEVYALEYEEIWRLIGARLCVVESVSEVLKYERAIKKFFESEMNKKTLDDWGFAVSTSLYYRGQADAKWDLLPNLFRLKPSFRAPGLPELEKMNFEKFNSQLHLYRQKPSNSFAAYAIAQHYGLPTRLLDWSRNILKALFFACYDEANLREDGKLFCFSPQWTLSRFSAMREDRKIWDPDFSKRNFASNYARPDGEYIQKTTDYILGLSADNKPQWLDKDEYWPTPVLPIVRDRRIFAQEGAFTFYMNNKTPDERGNRIFRIVIPAKSKKDIFEELNRLGINCQTMFPDLEHFVNHLKIRAGLTDFVDGYQID